jgi:chaperonin GroES
MPLSIETKTRYQVTLFAGDEDCVGDLKISTHPGTLTGYALNSKSKFLLKRKYRMNLKPLGDRLIVEPIEQKEMTASGIVLPETAKEKPMQGKVLAIGPGGRKEDGSRIVMDVSMGDTVLYPKYGGTEVKLESKKYLILKEADVLAIVQ